MNCGEAKKLFSPYLDGQVNGIQMRVLRRHLDGCERCARDFASLEDTQQLLMRIGPKKAPADLALKLRVAISREAALARHRRWEGFMVRLENAITAIMVPATAGLVSAVVIFGLLLGFFLPGDSLQKLPCPSFLIRPSDFLLDHAEQCFTEVDPKPSGQARVFDGHGGRPWRSVVTSASRVVAS